MPNEPPQKDLVIEARRLLAKDTPAPWLRIDPELLRQLCDEIERRDELIVHCTFIAAIATMVICK